MLADFILVLNQDLRVGAEETHLGTGRMEGRIRVGLSE